jgi:glycosyltransferase involved in cell wall biosynthesis
MLVHVTPVLLTYNEAPNIAAALSRLAWAKDVVVVDSASTDRTLAILAAYPNVRVFVRPFDTHAGQWRYAVHDTGITTPWILRLDADYLLTDELVRELTQLDPGAPVSAYRIGFDYAVFSQRLRSSLYPAKTVLLRQGRFEVWDNGHTESWAVDGPVVTLNGRIIHDDWKATDVWMGAQGRYMRRELAKFPTCGAGLRGWLRRRPPLMPFVVFLYCLFGKGLILNGRAGLFYAMQRMVAEAALSLMLLEARLRAKAEANGTDEDNH